MQWLNSGLEKNLDLVKRAQEVFDIEAQAVLALKDKLDTFPEAIDIILSCQGKVIVTGMGKSGVIGRKIAATLSSTGTPAFFLHPAESSHGDLGVVAKEDVVIALSNSGESAELNDLLGYLARKNIPLIAMTGRKDSTLGKAAQVILDISVEKEACPLGLAPTASSTATLAMGDALAVTLLKQRGFSEKDFAEYHPGGKLGRRLFTRVKNVMHQGEALPLVKENTPLKEVLTVMTGKEVRGVAGVLNSKEQLVGVITDGDIRRLLEKDNCSFEKSAEEIMNKNPKTVDLEELAEKALFMMEQFAIQTLFVVNRNSQETNCPVGLLHLQDLLRAKIR